MTFADRYYDLVKAVNRPQPCTPDEASLALLRDRPPNRADVNKVAAIIGPCLNAPST
ncbi:MAG TPA: hypothetical protein VFQ44_01840 [Streptosporangiaceae bacterium]|nr:hypothetical protein [Streptosporangiaceae bacterium]